MMTRALPIALGLLLISIAAIQGYAFMVASQNLPAEEALIVAAQTDVWQKVDLLQAEMAAGETPCPVMRAKLDAAIGSIDRLLDTGTGDEAASLEARDALIEMRTQLPCVARADGETGILEEAIADGSVLIDGPFVDGGYDPGGFTGAPGGYGTGGGGYGTGGGGGGIGGGGGGLLAAGVAAAIAIPLATSSNDSTPGTPATR